MNIFNKKYIRNSDILSTQMDGEVVMMDSKAGLYFNLSSGVGAAIWGLMENAVNVDEIVIAVCKEYNVTPADCRDDIQDFINHLAAHQLVTLVKVV